MAALREFHQGLAFDHGKLSCGTCHEVGDQRTVHLADGTRVAMIDAIQLCRQCHGPRLTGGVPGQLGPFGPDLNLVRDWRLAEFITTMRTGIDPNGRELSGQMPWRPIGRMDDEELAAVYEYLTHLPDS